MTGRAASGVSRTVPSYPPGAFPAVRRVRRDPLGFLQALAADGGALVHLRLGRHPAFLLNDPDLVEDVLIRHAHRIDKGRAFERARRLLGNGLLTASGPAHTARRRVAQPLFHREHVSRYAAVMTARAAALGQRWRSGERIDIAREMASLTLGIVGEALFGTELASYAAAIREAVQTAAPGTDGLVAIVGPPRRVSAARRRLDAVVDALIADRLRSGAALDDLLAHMLASRAGEPEGSLAQVRDDVITMLLAGHDTLAHALTWTWLLLARHPHADARLHAEASGALDDPMAPAEAVARLGYARGVLAESLRLFPPAWVIVRRAVEPFELAGRRIPAGAFLLASPFLMHRDPRFFPEPLVFDPDRWQGHEPHALPKAAFFPFGVGPRSCIGEGFAWLEGTIVLATLARRWRLTPVEKVPVVPDPRITLRATGPIWMMPCRRDQESLQTNVGTPRSAAQSHARSRERAERDGRRGH